MVQSDQIHFTTIIGDTLELKVKLLQEAGDNNIIINVNL